MSSLKIFKSTIEIKYLSEGFQNDTSGSYLGIISNNASFNNSLKSFSSRFLDVVFGGFIKIAELIIINSINSFFSLYIDFTFLGK